MGLISGGGGELARGHQATETAPAGGRGSHKPLPPASVPVLPGSHPQLLLLFQVHLALPPGMGRMEAVCGDLFEIEPRRAVRGMQLEREAET